MAHLKSIEGVAMEDMRKAEGMCLCVVTFVRMMCLMLLCVVFMCLC